MIGVRIPTGVQIDINMKKEEYIRRLKELNDRILQLQNEKKTLEYQYVKESELNSFIIGEKVLVRKRGEVLYAFVVGYEIIQDEVILVLNKCKKDGTPAKNLRVYYYPQLGDKVEKIC